MHKLKILMLAPTPFFSDRGAHVQIYEQAKALQKLNNEVTILTYGIGENVLNINIIRCWTPKYYKKITAGPSFTKLILLPVMAFKLVFLARKIKPDLIHAHLHEGALIAKATRKIIRIPVVFDYQGSLSGEVSQYLDSVLFSPIILFLRLIETMINSWFPVVTQSDKMVNEIRRRNTKFAIINIKDGVDVDRFKPMAPDEQLARLYKIDDTEGIFVYLGYFAKHQGFDLLLNAFQKVSAVQPKAKLLIIGYPLTNYYANFIKNLKIDKNVILIGKVSYFDAHRYLSLAKYAVAPKISITEGDGKIYNYMAMGLITITFDRDTSREILENSAVYASEISIDALANAMLKALKSSEKLGMESRKLAVEKLSWDKVGMRLVDFYNDVIA